MKKIKFHIPRQMTKYELFNYLKTLYGVEMTHIELEAKDPVLYAAKNVDHAQNLHVENYQVILFEYS